MTKQPASRGPELKWNKVSDWCLESHDKRYSVAKYLVAGEAVYQAVRKPDVSLLVARNAEQCKAACQSDKGI